MLLSSCELSGGHHTQKLIQASEQSGSLCASRAELFYNVSVSGSSGEFTKFQHLCPRFRNGFHIQGSWGQVPFLAGPVESCRVEEHVLVIDRHR